MTQTQLEEVARALVKGLWREFQRRNPGQANPVTLYDEMRPRDRLSWQRVASGVVLAVRRAEAASENNSQY